MSETTASEQGQDEISYTVLESSDNTSDSTNSNGDQEPTTLEQRESEEPALEYVANVDVTVKTGDIEGDSSSSLGSEDSKEQDAEVERNDETSDSDADDDDDNVEEEENESEDDIDETDAETVTCALLGLEHAKVMC